VTRHTAAIPAPRPPRPEPWEPRLRYHAWILQQLPTPDDLTRQRLAVHRWRDAPAISVVTPVYNTPPEMLRRMVQSVRRQSYPHWELCLVDDGSPAPWMTACLARLAAGDSRIRVTRRAQNGGIVAASNDALAMATGDFVALLDDDDELDPRALFAVAREIVARRDVDAIYTDFDVIGTDGIRYEPVLAPDWSPELLLAIPYIVHLTAYRRDLVQRLGGFRAEYEGSQDYDLALRVTRATDRIVHIPEVLYHWRAWARSAAGNPAAKPYAYAAGIRAITEHLRGHAFEARREEGHGIGLHAVRFAIQGQPPPLVSVIVPLLPRNGDVDVNMDGVGVGVGVSRARETGSVLRNLSALVRGTAYARCEYVIVGPAAESAWVMSALAASDVDALRQRARFVAYDGPPDAALAANLGAAHARGEHLLFLDDGLEPLCEDWLSALLEFSQQPGIGAVGAKIYRNDDTIWHGGLIVPRAAPHLVWRDDAITRNYAAVSGACLMTRRATFDALGGFQPGETVGCSDVDYCLRLRERGERIVFTPYARLRHVAAPPPEAGPARRATFHRHWRDRMQLDPYYNRNYRQDGPWFAVALD
jgi:GT2 family glycosyltransferase